ncbi:hypothetical protein ABZX75_17610 [Streptomyces sp. NPDC003038]|uniref:hypothetical protein n=1 Tax=unclassified Streptomyces TaxID=2593676 RepID=UPI0033AAE937
MTPRPGRSVGIHRPAPDDVALHPGTVRTGWCRTCKAWTHLTADLLLLSPDGLTLVGTWAWCEVCDDPENPLPVRRIDRAGP